MLASGNTRKAEGGAQCLEDTRAPWQGTQCNRLYVLVPGRQVGNGGRKVNAPGILINSTLWCGLLRQHSACQQGCCAATIHAATGLGVLGCATGRSVFCARHVLCLHAGHNCMACRAVTSSAQWGNPAATLRQAPSLARGLGGGVHLCAEPVAHACLPNATAVTGQQAGAALSSHSLPLFREAALECMLHEGHCCPCPRVTVGLAAMT